MTKYNKVTVIKIGKVKGRYEYSAILLKELVITDFKLRYQGSVLGYLWSLLRPLAIFAVLYFVFVRFLKIGEGIPHYAIYLLLGIVLWNFFVEVTSASVSSIVSRGDLIRKINFPKYVIVLSSSVSALINLGLNLIVVSIFMIIFGTDASWWALLIIPLILFELYVFGLAFAFLLSALNVKYRDMGFIWEVVMQIGFYATPILYPLTMLPLNIQKLLFVNPMAQIIQTARYYLVTPHAITSSAIFHNPFYRAIPFVVVIFFIVVGCTYFMNNSKKFAEDV